VTLELWLGGGVFAALVLIESLVPFQAQSGRAAHDLTNGSLAVVNALIGAALAPLTTWSAATAAEAGLGLTRLVPLPGWLALILALVLFDLWMYLWHRANHRVALLWRLHRVHHTDPQMNASTALRFHPGEILISMLLNSGVVVLIGLDLEALVLYKTMMVAVILLHHSNVRLPDLLDRTLRAVLVPPSMHRVHHSDVEAETNSNYGTVLSVWDRLFGSFRLRTDPQSIRYGIGRFADSHWKSPLALLLLPLRGPA